MDFLTYFRSTESDGGRSGATFDSPATAELVATQEANGEWQQRSTLDDRGWKPVTGSSNTRYRESLDACERLVEKAMRGDRWARLRLEEALTTSDFGTYFGDVLDRSMLANYAETPYTWDTYCARKVLNDFRLARMLRSDRGAAVLDGPLTPNSYGATGAGSTGIEQTSEYPMRKRVITGYTDQLYKFGARMDFSYETIINDDLDALKDVPALFGRAARRTEEKRATALYVSSGGPNATFFSNANLNLINSTVLGSSYTGLPNPPLSIDSVMWALTVLANQRDLDGEPISIEAAVLVYPPALKVTAENILNARELHLNIEGGTVATYGATVNPASNFTAATSGARLVTANWAAKFATGALNYYLPVVNTSSSAQTAWYVFASPKGRPALQQSFLRGCEAPHMFMKSSNQIMIGEGRLGGGGTVPGAGLANPMEGDFENDTIDYKVRHFLGGTLLDPVCAVASTGLGV